MPKSEPQPPPDEIEQFLDSFDTFAQAVRRARGARAGAPASLTLSQYGLLEPLLHEDRARISRLASGAGITAPTATRILDTLERRGLVERTRARDDRRGVSVRLTDPGRAELTRHHDWLQSRQRAFYASLETSEQQIAPDLMVRLAALIDEIAGGPSE